ncbi:MAG: DUF4199 family protein [Putridiphycobacter sp.]
MKPTVKVALVCVLISASITMIFFYAGKSEMGYEISNFINLFMLLTAISVGLFLTRKALKFAETNFLEDIKSAMQGGIVYIILMGLFLYVYHLKIDPSIVNQKREQRIELLDEIVPNEAAYLELQKEDATWKGKSYLDYLENQHDSISLFISAKFFAIANVIVGLILSVFFSVMTVIILRKVVLR